MIILDSPRQEMVDRYLAAPVVESRLRLESWLGDSLLGTLIAQAGTLKWDAANRLRGHLDVDVEMPVEAAAAIGPTHPIGPFGQILRAWWEWPQIGVQVPAGWWRIDLPSPRDRLWWTVAADPAPFAAADRAKWLTAPQQIISGDLASQLDRVAGEVPVGWDRGAGFLAETAVPDLTVQVDTNVLDALIKVWDAGLVEAAPARDTGRIIVTSPGDPGTPVWTLDTGSNATKVTPKMSVDDVINEVCVWYEVPAEPGSGGTPTYVSAVEQLTIGPRRVDGPYGRAGKAVKLDASVPTDRLREIAAARLQEAQLAVTSVSVTTRADPRREVGDCFRVVSLADDVDAVCRCTAMSLDAGTGMSTIDGAVITGHVNGITTEFVGSRG